MRITLQQVVVWLVIGAIAGSLAGLMVKRSRQGFGRFANLGLGLVGAFIGGAIFRVFNIDLGLGAISVSLEDIVAAFLGAIFFLLILRWIRKR